MHIGDRGALGETTSEETQHCNRRNSMLELGSVKKMWYNKDIDGNYIWTQFQFMPLNKSKSKSTNVLS